MKINNRTNMRGKNDFRKTNLSHVARQNTQKSSKEEKIQKDEIKTLKGGSFMCNNMSIIRAFDTIETPTPSLLPRCFILGHHFCTIQVWYDVLEIVDDQ